jgi:hypothetical protein
MESDCALWTGRSRAIARFDRERRFRIGQTQSAPGAANVPRDLIYRLLLRPGFLSHLPSLMAAMNQKGSLRAWRQSLSEALTADNGRELRPLSQ